MAEESFYREGSNISLKNKNAQIDYGKKKLYGFNFRVGIPEPHSGTSHPTASPPQTPPHNRQRQARPPQTPPQDEVRRTATTPVRHIEEVFTTYKTVGWTPPEQDTSSVAASSVINTCIFEENPPTKVPPPEYYKLIPNDLSNQQRLTQAILWSLRYSFDNDKPPTTTTTSPSSTSKEAMQGKIFARQLKMRFMEELAKGNIEIQELSPSASKNPSMTNPTNIKNAEKLNLLQKNRRLLAQEYKEWDKYEQKLNDKMAKFFENQATEKQKIPISKEGIYDYLDHLDQEQVNYFREHIESAESTGVPLKEFEINEIPTLMRQSLNTVKAFEDHVDTFERNASDDLSLRMVKRTRFIPDDHEIPSALDDKANKHNKIETAEKILQLLIQSAGKENQAE